MLRVRLKLGNKTQTRNSDSNSESRPDQELRPKLLLGNQTSYSNSDQEL
jgi:hypothetical protein